MKNILKRSSIGYVVVALAIVILGGCSSNLWDEMPSPISSFISQYFPGQSLSGFSDTPDGGHRVDLTNGASVTFDINDSWTILDGNGKTLPEVAIYDLLPPALYEYLEEMGATDGVYKMSRTSSVYIVTLVDTYLTYDVDSGAINYPTASGASSKSASGF
nr:hypothetical protein [Bacteroides sp.]